MTKEEITIEFEKNKFVYESLKTECEYTLNESITREKIKIHSINSRIKSLDSFLNKCERKSYDDPFNTVTDVVGIRIVCLFRADIEKVGRIIAKEFEVVDQDNKIDDTEVSSFGYMSFHYIVKIKASYSGTRYDPIKGFLFEIQVRTIAMDAWASISHYLDYKNKQDVPLELRKDFHALSGLFYLADTHFKMFFEASQKSKRDIGQNLDNKVKNILINSDSLTVFLTKKYPDRDKCTSKNISDLVSDLKLFNYNTIESLEKMIDSAKHSFNEYEKEVSKKFKYKMPFYTPEGVVRRSLYITDPKYRTFLDEHREEKYKKLELV